MAVEVVVKFTKSSFAAPTLPDSSDSEVCRMRRWPLATRGGADDPDLLLLPQYLFRPHPALTYNGKNSV